MKQIKLEKLLRMTVPVPEGCITPAGTPMTPDFRIAVQEIIDDGVRIIVHPLGHDGDTLDFVVSGDQLITHNASENDTISKKDMMVVIDELEEQLNLTSPNRISNMNAYIAVTYITQALKKLVQPKT